MLVSIRMLCDARGAPHGHTVHEYVAGGEYDVPPELAHAFMAMGVAHVAYVRAYRNEPEVAPQETVAETPAVDAVPAAPATTSETPRAVARTRRMKVRA